MSSLLALTSFMKRPCPGLSRWGERKDIHAAVRVMNMLLRLANLHRRTRMHEPFKTAYTSSERSKNQRNCYLLLDHSSD